MPVQRTLLAVLAVALAAPAAAHGQAQSQGDLTPTEISGNVRIDVTWTEGRAPGEYGYPNGGDDYRVSPQLTIADAAGGRLGLLCSSQDETANAANPGDVPCRSFPVSGFPLVPGVHWAGTGWPPHVALVDDDPAAARGLCLFGSSYRQVFEGHATFTDPGGAQRTATFAAPQFDFALIGATPEDIRWQPHCYRATGGGGPATPDYVPVPGNQALKVSHAGAVAVRVNGIDQFRGKGAGTVEVTLSSAPPRSSGQKAITLGKGTGGVGAGPATVRVPLSAKALKAIRHRSSLRVSIQAIATDTAGTKGNGFAYAQLRDPFRRSR